MNQEDGARGPVHHATAQYFAGDVGAIAYSVRLNVSGPNGETTQAFVLVTRDRGATWTPFPLVRTIGSNLRFWGFPVWPPESIDTVEAEAAELRIQFRDEWVAFEPGGESAWRAVGHANGLWTVARVRLMDYDLADKPAPAPPIDVALPPDIAGPPQSLVEGIALRVAGDVPSRGVDRYGWLIAVPCGAPFAVWGLSWRAVAATLAMVAALPIVSILLARRRYRRMYEA